MGVGDNLEHSFAVFKQDVTSFVVERNNGAGDAAGDIS
ncbi:MAG: hypothetical protein UX38_C0004G0033 [Microgenomates group bacterium GW2011_GWC1_46_16]|nr:MAG: hypothetical protein UX38_C0004G0033 [Microgenomates group bacterium GW2011_GWC1_46_16]